MQLPGVDLANPDLFLAGWPHEAFALLRAQAPVYWHEEANGPGFWVVSKYHDVLAVQLDAKTFSSARGGTLIDRKSTRLNSSHTVISYAVFCLKKKKKTTYTSI